MDKQSFLKKGSERKENYQHGLIFYSLKVMKKMIEADE